ncbi:MAG: zur 1 [Firmicutes bacterium]|nr:zur 1 [Bacillota bacterium]
MDTILTILREKGYKLTPQRRAVIQLGLVHEIQLPGRDGNVFELTTRHHHHLICMKCGQAECLDYCPVSQRDIEKAAERGFEILSHSLEFYGFCRSCRVAG